MGKARKITIPIVDEILSETTPEEKSKILNKIMKEITLEQIKTNWSKTDDAIYGDNEYEKKLASLEAAKTKVIAKN